MKRILFFLLLLVNLQLTTDNGSLSIGFGEIVAQRTQEEQLSASEIPGNSRVPCEYCGNLIQENLLSEHKSVYCSKRPSGQQTTNNGTMCSSCKKPESECKCGMVGGVCSFCKKPANLCNCLTVKGNGSKNTGSLGNIPAPTGGVITIPDIEPTPTPPNNGGGGGSSGSRSWGGGSLIGYQWSNGSMQGGESSSTISVSRCTTIPPISVVPPSDRPFGRVSMKMLKSMQNVTLLPNLPDMLHVQPDSTHDCCPRAIAFMLELKSNTSFNYKKVFEELKQIAKDKGYDCKKKGVPFVPSDRIDSLYNKYHVIGDALSESAIIRKINEGIPVAIGVLDPNPEKNHMVTVIGYDYDYFFVAAGNPECSANMIPRGSLRNERNWFSSCLYYISK